jgi:hypothetical protein
MFCNGFSSAFSGVFASVFQTHVSSISSIFRRMLQVDRALHMLQWRQWLTNSSLSEGFGSYIAWCASPSALLSLPFLPFPPSRRSSSSSAEKLYLTSTQTPV